MEKRIDVSQQFAAFFPDHRLRYYAALTLRRLTEGHICTELSSLEGDHRLPDHLPMVGRIGDREPFIIHNDRLYLEKYFFYETQIIRRLGAFLRSSRERFDERRRMVLAQSELIRSLFSPGAGGSSPQVDWQLVAALCAATSDFTMITGKPGTGKTTTVARLLAILFATDPGLRIALAAPTGKAAARMKESLSAAPVNGAPELSARLAELQPMTIHRLLGTLPDASGFRHGADCPLPFQVLIVDEASMIDAALFSKLLSAVGEETRLILLGDKDQLASVEAGSVFGDLCQLDNTVNCFPGPYAELLDAFGMNAGQGDSDAGPLAGHVVELQESRRFSPEAGIGRFSTAVISNDAGILGELLDSGGNEQVRLDEEYRESEFEQFVLRFREYMLAPDPLSALKAFGKLRILCALTVGEQGVSRINRRVEDLLRSARLLTTGGEFYVNRPVMVTGNNYELGLFNGDIGIIRPDEDGRIKAWFEHEDGVRGLLPASLPDIQTVFAMTIHKSQGSEYDEVLVLAPRAAHEQLLTRELLYTAVTRARHRVVVQASREKILQMAAASVQRASGIKERLNELGHVALD